MKHVSPFYLATTVTMSAFVALGCGDDEEPVVEGFTITIDTQADPIRFSWDAGPMSLFSLFRCESGCFPPGCVDGTPTAEQLTGTWSLVDDSPSPQIESPLVYGESFPNLSDLPAQPIEPGQVYYAEARLREVCSPDEDCDHRTLALGCGVLDLTN